MVTYRTQYSKRRSCRCRTCEMVLLPFLGINEMHLLPSGWFPRSSGIIRGAQVWDRKNGDGDFEVFLLLF
jgi:hypothetical protein